MNDERYHYLECGLDDVYLVNGFERFETARGTSIAIKDIDTLHRVIGEHLCRDKKELRGKEFRFIRREMSMSQATLAELLDVREQTVHRWETGKSPLPKTAETLMRLLYTDRIRSVRDRLKRIADLEDEIDHLQEMIFELKEVKQREQSSEQSPAQWALAA